MYSDFIPKTWWKFRSHIDKLNIWNNNFYPKFDPLVILVIDFEYPMRCSSQSTSWQDSGILFLLRLIQINIEITALE